MANPVFRAVHAAAAAPGRFEPDAGPVKEVMCDELFSVLLRDTLIAQPEFETLLTRLRASLLFDTELRERAPLDFLCDLALQCFNNEFVFAEGQAESARIAQLEREIDAVLRDRRAIDEPLQRLVATIAMYRPLRSMSGIEGTVGQPWQPHSSASCGIR
jgi:hypothetical protein